MSDEKMARTLSSECSACGGLLSDDPNETHMVQEDTIPGLSEDEMRLLREIARLKNCDIATAWEKAQKAAETLRISPEQGIVFLFQNSATESRIRS